MALRNQALTGQGSTSRGGTFGRDGGYNTAAFVAGTTAGDADRIDQRGFSSGGFRASGAATITFLQGFADDQNSLVAAYDTKDRTAPAVIAVVVAAAGYYDLPVELWTAEILGVYAGAGITLRFSYKK